MNLAYGPARHESFVAQWLEHPTGVRKVQFLSETREFFFVSCLSDIGYVISHSLTELKIYQLSLLTPDIVV